MGIERNGRTGSRLDMNIDDQLEPLTVYNYDVSPAMDGLIKHVLKMIPERYTEKFPSFSVFECHSPWDAHVEPEGLVFLDPSLLNLPRNIAVGIIAHEFAHVFLMHIGKGGLGDEHAADALACRWGFRKQLEAMRESCGPPTEE